MVTKAFCEWVASIGGDTNNIEEQTILSLFASGYETKPALSVPIHIVELNNIPPELRSFAMATLPGAGGGQGTTSVKPVNIPPMELLVSSIHTHTHALARRHARRTHTQTHMHTDTHVARIHTHILTTPPALVVHTLPLKILYY